MPARRDEVCVPGPRKRRKFFGLLIGGLAVVPQLFGQAPATPTERVTLPIFQGAQDSFGGSFSTRDYFVRLPEHILFRDGTEVETILHPSESLLPAVCVAGLAVNDRLIVSTNLHASGNEIRAGAIRLGAIVPREVLSGGWNKISFRFTLHTAKGADRETIEKATWTLRSSESYLALAFERQPLFPELARFPHTLTEEKLLLPNQDAPFADMIPPALSILVPGRGRQVHLRAAAIVGARLGQVGYLDDAHCRVQAIEFWKTETDQRNAVIIARRDQLGGIELPANIRAAITGLRARQGLLAEFFVGPPTHQRRVLLVTGADDNGLEQAALTLGSSPALDAAPPSPSVVDEMPTIATSLEAEARPGPSIVRLSGTGLVWHGLYRSEQAFSGWRLPSGFQIGDGSALKLELTCAPTIVATNSSLEALVNGVPIGTIRLSAASTNGNTRLPLPTGLPGRDPMTVTFRASLDGGEGTCGQGDQAQVRLRILPQSQIENSAEPSPLRGLQDLGRFLARDRFGRRAAFVLPDGPGLDQVRLLFSLAFHLGKQSPSSPVLWPEVVTYRTGAALDTARLKGRSVLLLGSVAQWAEVLGDGAASPAVSMASAPDTVVIEGHEYPMNRFDPALALIQFLPSPWADGEKLVVAGSWRDYAVPTVKRLLRDFSGGELQGDLAALTSSGVIVSCNSEIAGATSFADRIARPQGNEPAIAMALPGRSALSAAAQDSNLFLFYACGGVLVLLVAARLLLMWEQARIREKAMAADRATGGHP